MPKKNYKSLHHKIYAAATVAVADSAESCLENVSIIMCITMQIFFTCFCLVIQI